MPDDPFAMTYDANGYVNYVPMMDYGQNPWSGVVNQSNKNYGNATAAAANIGDMQNKAAMNAANMNRYAQETAKYPAMANDYGLGLPSGNSGGDMDSGSRGFNPWSLQGEALSR